MIIIDWNIRLHFIIFDMSNMTQARQESVPFYHVFHEQSSAWVEAHKPEGASDASHERDQIPPLVNSVQL